MYVHRLGSAFLEHEERINDFLKFIDLYPNSCHEVWLSSTYGFPKTEKHLEYARKLKPLAKRFRDKGIKVSLQISNTLGHGPSGLNRDNTGLFDNPDNMIVDENGERSNCILCSTSPEMLDYLREEVRIYLEEIEPEGVWVDDDLRLDISHTCYCDRCMSIFNELNGTSFTREDIVNNMHTDKDIRDKWVSFNAWRMGNVARAVGETIHKYSPDTYPALQNGAHGFIKGNWQKAVYDAYYETTGNEGHFRPGGGAYDDLDPNNFFLKANYFAQQTRWLPESVKDICPEIENLPDVVYGKSIAGQTFETAYYFAAAGATTMSYATMMRVYEPMEWLSLQLRDMSKNYIYFKRMAEVNKRTKFGGVELYMPDTPWKVLDSKKPYDWEPHRVTEGTEFIHCAIPVSLHKNNRGAGILHGAHAEGMTDEEIEKLLSENVFCDGRAAEIVCQRGFGKDLGITIEKRDVRQFTATYNMEHPACEGLYSKNWSMNFFGSWHYVVTGGNFETVTEYKGVRDSSVSGGASDVVVTTSKGGRWYIAAYTPWTWQSVLSFDKRNQYMNALEYIGAKTDAVLLDRIPARVFPRIDDNGKTVAVSLVNTTVGESGELHLLIKEPAGDKFTFCQINGEMTEVKAEKTDKGTLVTFPSVRPWGVATVFVD